MNWKHIKDIQPDDGSRIVQLDNPCEGYSYIGFRTFDKNQFQEFMKRCSDYDIPSDDFFWVYEHEFPFPKVSV